MTWFGTGRFFVGGETGALNDDGRLRFLACFLAGDSVEISGVWLRFMVYVVLIVHQL